MEKLKLVTVKCIAQRPEPGFKPSPDQNCVLCCEPLILRAVDFIDLKGIWFS